MSDQTRQFCWRNLAAVLGMFFGGALFADDRPNIVLIMADEKS